VTHQVPLLRRALMDGRGADRGRRGRAALTAEPGPRPLLLLRGARMRPGTLDEDAAAQLLTGPLGAATPWSAQAPPARGKPRRAPGGDDGRTACRRPQRPRDSPDRRGRPRMRPGQGGRSAGARSATTASDGNAQDTLWAVWHASGLAREWQAASAAGGNPRRRRRTATSTPWSRCSRPPRASPSACRPGRLALSRQPVRPGNPGRHAGGPGAGR